MKLGNGENIAKWGPGDGGIFCRLWCVRRPVSCCAAVDEGGEAVSKGVHAGAAEPVGCCGQLMREEAVRTEGGRIPWARAARRTVRISLSVTAGRSSLPGKEKALVVCRIPLRGFRRGASTPAAWGYRAPKTFLRIWLTRAAGRLRMSRSASAILRKIRSRAISVV